MKTAYKKPVRKPTKPLIHADVFPNVITVHKGTPEEPTLRLVVHENPQAALITETLLKGLRVDYRVAVRTFTASGVQVK